MAEPKTTFTKEEFWAELDALGEEQVRINLYVIPMYGQLGMSGTGPQKYELAKIWLQKQQDQRDLEASSKRDARETETLKIANRANKIAIAAIVIAALAAIAAILFQK